MTTDDVIISKFRSFLSSFRHIPLRIVLSSERINYSDKEMAAGLGEMFIWSKLGQNPSEMDVRTFARIKNVIWDQLLATKAEIIQS